MKISAKQDDLKSVNHNSDESEKSLRSEEFFSSMQERKLQVNLKSNLDNPKLEESLRQQQEYFLQENLYQQKKAQFACMRGEFKKKGR